MFKSITTRLAVWKSRRETIRELSLLSNRELADLGISRGDIAFVADGPLFQSDEAFAPAALDDALIGPAWAAHAPTSLAA